MADNNFHWETFFNSDDDDAIDFEGFCSESDISINDESSDESSGEPSDDNADILTRSTFALRWELP
jgi:hypothetical protein